MKKSFLQSVVTNGLIIGLGLILVTVLDYILGFYGQNFAFSLLTYVVIIGGLIWAATSYRKKELGDYMSYGQAFGYSFAVSVVFVFISVIFTLILTQWIDPGYTERVMAITEQKLYDKGLSGDQVDMVISMSKRFSKPFFTVVIGFFSSLLVSAIISLITSAIVMRKDPNPFREQN